MKVQDILFKKLSIIMIAALLIAGESYGQCYTFQTNHIVYESSSSDKDSVMKHEYAWLCENYIQQYYNNKKLPSVYLIFEGVKEKELGYELAYDDLAGYGIGYEYYGEEARFNDFGIRIKIYSDMKKSEMLMLLDYGINNLKKMKRRRRYLIRHDVVNTIKSVSLPEEELLLLLFYKPLLPHIKEILEQ
ncbi:MAG: hypothetical protein V4581_05700 [Bacteroidota bacterium]